MLARARAGELASGARGVTPSHKFRNLFVPRASKQRRRTTALVRAHPHVAVGHKLKPGPLWRNVPLVRSVPRLWAVEPVQRCEQQ